MLGRGVAGQSGDTDVSGLWKSDIGSLEAWCPPGVVMREEEYFQVIVVIDDFGVDWVG